MKRSAFILFLLLSFFSARATHIVGGTMGYTYLGNAPNNMFRYRITLITYTDCSSSSEIPYPESSVSVGIYHDNVSMPQGDKILNQTLIAPLISAQTITPPLPPGCSIGQSTCIYKGVYEVEVLLESSTFGYHLYYERCCRNTALINILNPAQTSTGFYAFIPPTSVPNSSPVFLDDPVPLLCVNDSLFLLNSAVDADGDLLLYSFTTPYAGFADIMNPAPAPQPILPWPVTPVIYQNNFSSSQPFGPGGYTYINGFNGLSIYKTALVGNFAVAVQVSEYRFGNLISSTRRDMQFISTACPINQSPVGSFSSGLDVQIVEGDSSCFNFSYTDPDMDSVFVDVGGEPFLSVPAATYTLIHPSPDSATGNVCWAPPCGMARILPYFITFKAHDDGCPPKERVHVVKLTVIPDTARMSLIGLKQVCAFQTTTYHASKTSGTFLWSVTNGVINPATDGPSASVDWNIPVGQQGIISVIRVGPCGNDTATLHVAVAEPAFAGHLQDIWLCPGSSEQIEAEEGGGNYQWTPNSWLNNGNIYNPITNTPDSIIYHLSYRDSVGCEKYDSLLVSVNATVPADAGNNISVCENMPVQLGGNPTGPNNAQFQWSPTTNLTSDTVANPIMQNPQSGWYFVDVSVDTCHTIDSLQINVNSLPIVNAGSDTALCEGLSIQLNGSGTGNITWQTNGLIFSDTHIIHPSVSGSAGIYEPIIHITSAEGCTASDTVQIEFWSPPNIDIIGSSSVCRNDSNLLTATGAENYVWTSTAWLSSLQLATTYVLADSSVWVYLAASDSNGCLSTDSFFVDVFHGDLSLPAGADTILCQGDSIALTFNANDATIIHWFPANYLNSDEGATVISTPQSDVQYYVYASDASGCVDSAEVYLSVKPKPILSGSVEFQTQLFCDYTEVKLNSSNNLDSLSWFLNQINAGSGANITLHINTQYPENITLVGTSAFGCTDTISIAPNYTTLEQLLPPNFPNIITPNGDQTNDTWNPDLPSGFETCTRLSIYNRWGSLVFDTQSFPIAWLGKTNGGNSLTEGVYFYILEIGGIYKKGSITIAR